MATPPREGSEEAAPAPAPPVASVSPRVEGPEEAEDAAAVMAEKAAAISQASPPRRVPPARPLRPPETSCKQGAGGGPAGRKRPGWEAHAHVVEVFLPALQLLPLLQPPAACEEAAPRAPLLLPAPFLAAETSQHLPGARGEGRARSVEEGSS